MRRVSHARSHARNRWGGVWALLVGTALWLAPTSATAEWVDWIAGADLGFEYTDNLNLSAFNPDEEHDFSWYPRGQLGRVYQIGDLTRASITAEIGGEIYQRFNRLNAIEAGGTLSLIHKFGIGDEPWVRAFFYGAHKEIRETWRSGPRFEVGAQAGKRFSPRFDTSLTYRFTNRDGGNGPLAVPGIPTNVFDQQYHLVTLSGNYLLWEPLLLSVGYTFRGGEFDSACTVGNVGRVLAVENVKAIALDSVFGGCVYRLDGTGHAGFFNLSYGFTDQISLDFGYRYQYGKADVLTYSSNTTRLTLLFRY